MDNTEDILIIDDHPMVVTGYTHILESIRIDLQLGFEGAYNCSQALSMMNEKKNNFYSLILLDIRLPASTCHTIGNGEDLGCYIRMNYPKTRIIIQTGLNDVQCITNIFNSVKPEGFLIKSDIDEETLIASVSKVLQGKTFYSKKVKSLLSPKEFSEIYIDHWNRKILYHLSLGYKMKDLPNHIPLSLPSIERRKRDLKSLLGVPNGGNQELIQVAKKKGFL